MVICLNRSSKYPIKEIIRDYESGYSFPKLEEKYRIPRRTAWEMIRKNLGNQELEVKLSFSEAKGGDACLVYGNIPLEWFRYLLNSWGNWASSKIVF